MVCFSSQFVLCGRRLPAPVALPLCCRSAATYDRRTHAQSQQTQLLAAKLGLLPLRVAVVVAGAGGKATGQWEGGRQASTCFAKASKMKCYGGDIWCFVLLQQHGIPEPGH